jgi:hypothetical protein
VVIGYRGVRSEPDPLAGVDTPLVGEELTDELAPIDERALIDPRTAREASELPADSDLALPPLPEPSEADRAGLTGALAPQAATTVDTPHGPIGVPGTAFVDGSSLLNAPGSTEAVIPVWPEPFQTGGSPACSLPHASAVLVIESRAGTNGSQWFKVQHRECLGWVDAAHLGAQRPDEAAPADDPDGKAGK